MTAKHPATTIPAIDLVPTPLLLSPVSVLVAEAEEEVAVPELVTVWKTVVIPPSEAVDTTGDNDGLGGLERGVLTVVELDVLEGGGVVVVVVVVDVDDDSDVLDGGGGSVVLVVDFEVSVSDRISEPDWRRQWPKACGLRTGGAASVMEGYWRA